MRQASTTSCSIAPHVGLYGPINAQEIVERTVLDKSKVSRAVQKTGNPAENV